MTGKDIMGRKELGCAVGVGAALVGAGALALIAYEIRNGVEMGDLEATMRAMINNRQVIIATQSPTQTPTNTETPTFSPTPIVISTEIPTSTLVSATRTPEQSNNSKASSYELVLPETLLSVNTNGVAVVDMDKLRAYVRSAVEGKGIDVNGMRSLIAEMLSTNGVSQ